MSPQNQLSKPRFIRLNNNPNFRIDYYESNCYNSEWIPTRLYQRNFLTKSRLAKLFGIQKSKKLFNSTPYDWKILTGHIRVFASDSFTFKHECKDDGILISVGSKFPYTGVLYGLYDYFTCRIEPQEQENFSLFFPSPTISKNCSDSIRYKVNNNAIVE